LFSLNDWFVPELLETFAFSRSAVVAGATTADQVVISVMNVVGGDNARIPRCQVPDYHSWHDDLLLPATEINMSYLDCWLSPARSSHCYGS